MHELSGSKSALPRGVRHEAGRFPEMIQYALGWHIHTAQLENLTQEAFECQDVCQTKWLS